MIAYGQALLREAVARAIVASGGFSVTACVGDAEQLLKAVEKRPPSLVIIESEMAGATRLLRRLSLNHRHIGLVSIAEVATRSVDIAEHNLSIRRFSKHDTFARLLEVIDGHFDESRRDRALSKNCDDVASAQMRSSEPLRALTRRELQVLEQLAEGLSVAECAKQLNISSNTVDNHKSRIMEKLGIHKTVQLVRFAIRHGIVTNDD